MDKIHREVVTNLFLNHTYFTKIAFTEGKSEILGNFEFFNQFSTINLRSRVPKNGIFQKNVNKNFI